MAGLPKKQALRAGNKRPKTDDLEAFRDISDDVIESDFVPYACLADNHSLFTKNGEILQIIKISGRDYAHRKHGADLRAAIREAIFNHIPDTSYAIWLHTMRHKHTLVEKSFFPDGFSARVDEAWSTNQSLDLAFTNELYITIVKAGQDASLFNLQTLLKSLWPPQDTKLRNDYLDEANRALDMTVQDIISSLSEFGARRLGIVERKGVYYSEQLEFLEKLINLEERPMALPTQDLSHYLTSGEITFGFNAMEVRTAEGKRRFACILTLKEYKESSLAGIDQFLEIPCEVIISQCFDFVGAAEAKETYEKQQRYLRLSGDKELAEWTEIDRLTEHKNNPERAFGQQQCSIFLIAPGVKQLEANIKLVRKALTKLGIVTVREDLKFEEMYWAQLPGNFPFIARKRSTNTMHLAGFANLQRAPMGNTKGSKWGPTITVMQNLQRMPYFFNFHDGAAAHTAIIGRPRKGRTTMAHFLLAQSRKLQPRIWYLDTRGRAATLMQSLGGTYDTIGTIKTPLSPFKLPDDPANREFLALWLTSLFDPKTVTLNNTMLAFFAQVVTELYKLPAEKRTMTVLHALLKANDPVLAKQIEPYIAGGAKGDLFDLPSDSFNPGPIAGFNISHVMDDVAKRVSMATYLLHRMTMLLDGKPTIIVLDEGFLLMDNPIFGTKAQPWLDYLTKMNTMVLMMTGRPEESANLRNTPAIMQRMVTQVFLPDNDPIPQFIDRYGLTEQEYQYLTQLSPIERHFMLKRIDGTHILTCRLDGLGVLNDTLSGRVAAPTASAAEVLAGLMAPRKETA
jgi:type IV secretion system protein VirB4